MDWLEDSVVKLEDLVAGLEDSVAGLEDQVVNDLAVSAASDPG